MVRPPTHPTSAVVAAWTAWVYGSYLREVGRGDFFGKGSISEPGVYRILPGDLDSNIKHLAVAPFTRGSAENDLTIFEEYGTL